MLQKQILFVDPRQDEPDGALHLSEELRGEWDSTVVSRGDEALKAMKKGSFDVVISELNMPDMSGAQLFQKVAEQNPGTVRLVLTDDGDGVVALQAAGHVHQCIARPCEPETLMKLLRNSMGLRELLANDGLHARIASITSLPSPPELYCKLVAELQKEDVSFSKIAVLIRQDIAINAKLIQLINSAFFGLRNPIQSTHQAISLLGMDMVRSLVLAAGVFDQFVDPGVLGFSVESIYARAMTVGSRARQIANTFGLRKHHIEDSLMAGMLHDVGKLVMLTQFPEELQQAAKLAKEESTSLHEAVEKVIGICDTDIGAYLLSLWGLPDSILEAVALHCQPAKSPCPMKNALTTVHLAYALDCDEKNHVTDDESSAVDMEYLRELKLDDQLPNIRDFALAAAN
jgi:HD-like signal output (HDOD) protein